MSVPHEIARHIGVGILLGFACSVTCAEDLGPLVIANQGYFFVGGKYIDTPNGQVMAGQAYVEYQVPKNRRITDAGRRALAEGR